MKLVFDTETTGLDYSDDRIVQIAWMALHDDYRPGATWFHSYLKTDVPISAKAAKVNGLTTEEVNRRGKEPRFVLNMFFRAVEMCDEVFAHFAEFDMGFVEETACREGLVETWDRLAYNRKWTCTKELAKPLFPEKERGPRLQELHEMFVGGEIDGRHDALGDTRALAACLPGLLKAIGHVE